MTPPIERWSGTPGELVAFASRGVDLRPLRSLALWVPSVDEFSALPSRLEGLTDAELSVSLEQSLLRELVARRSAPGPEAGWLARLLALAPFRALSLEVGWQGAYEPTLVGRWLLDALGLEAPRCEALASIEFSFGGVSAALFERMARWPLGALRSLVVAHDELDDRAVRALHACPWLRSLDALGLEHCGLRARAFTALAEGGALEGLRELDLNNNGLGVAFARSFAACTFDRLRTLNVCDNRLDDEALAVLARAPLPVLEELSLRSNPISDDGACVLAASPFVRRLTTLYLGLDYGHALTIRGLHALASTGKSTSTVLHYSSLGLTDEALVALAADPRLAAFTSLDLSFNHAITGAGVEALARSPFVSKAVGLDLAGAQVGHRGLAAIAASEGLAGLRSLGLGGCALGAGGFALLVRARFAPVLVRLDTAGCGLTAIDLEPLASHGLPALERLMLSNNPVGDGGALALACASDLSKLAQLYLANTGLTDEGAELLRSARALASVREFYLHGNAISPALERALDADPRVQSC